MRSCGFADNPGKSVVMKEKLKRIVDSEVTLVPYYPNYEVTLEWYQDPDVCKQVDNIDDVYSLDLLKAMYSFLSENGDCYYIEYKGELVGDVTLRNNKELCIVVCKEYQNRHIGRRCILNMLELARELEYDYVTANIYSFNTQSQRMFESIGFEKMEEEFFQYKL